jgi:hypothetical protein
MMQVMPAFKVAVVTPYHSEPRHYLEQMQRSVRRQTWPHVLHVLVGDEPVVGPELDVNTLNLVLPRGCRDYGDTPRALGALYAAGLGVDAVVFLDADNWYYPEHVETLVQRHLESGAQVLSSKRSFHRIDGTYMAECSASDGEQFVDTNCLFLARPAFPLLSRWALMDPQWHGIGDRAFWDHVKQHDLPRDHVARPTVAYRAQFTGAYEDCREPAPAEARRISGVAHALQSWTAATGRSLKVKWGYRHYQSPREILPIYALTIKEQGAVNLTRLGRPLQSLQDTGRARSVIGTRLDIPAQGPPGILILHRHFLADAGFRAHLDRLAAKGWLLVSDIDDDPHHWPGYVNSGMVAFKGVHAVTVSTPRLGEMIRQWNPHVQVLPNMVDDLPSALRHKRAQVLTGPYPATAYSEHKPLRVFFGAFNRRQDAEDLLGGLALVPFDQRARIHWVVLHDKDVFQSIPDGYGREFHPTCAWHDYMALLGGCDVAALPLRDTEFNRFKSDLKLVEALAAGAVPLCSPVVYQEAHGVAAPYARWASTPEQWAFGLIDALQNPQSWNQARLLGYGHVHRHRPQWQQDEMRIQLYRSWVAQQPSLERERQSRLELWASDTAVKVVGGGH